MAETTFLNRLRSAWNVFLNRESKSETRYNYGMTSSSPPHRSGFHRGNERSIVSSVYTRTAIDVASTRILHAKVDENGSYIGTIDSGLNRCLTIEANIDQTSRAFMLDVVISLFDEGIVAIVPVDTSVNLVNSGTFDILTLRTAKIIQWYPDHVRMQLYNDRSGQKEELTLPKTKVAIIENPLYAVMNEPNSTLQRLITKLNLLDAIDIQSSSGKLDLIVQLPFSIKSEQRRLEAERRRVDIQNQLFDSKYGIAYTDATEKITQLNRPVENNLLAQVEYLTRMLYSQLGMTEAVIDGTADEQTMLNYYSRTIEPVISSITLEMRRKFLTKTAQTQGQSIIHFRNPFSLVTATQLAELADKLTRNEIVTSNEFRAVIGFTPSKDPNADELRNKNLNKQAPQEIPAEEISKEGE